MQQPKGHKNLLVLTNGGTPEALAKNCSLVVMEDPTTHTIIFGRNTISAFCFSTLLFTKNPHKLIKAKVGK